ncbi:MAG: IS481 family transposase [Solirubrobacterales bacterium]
MTLHRKARTCPESRLLIARRVLEQGWTKKAAAEAAGVSEPTVAKWVRRFQEQGEAGLLDRSSAPKRVANRTPDDRIEAILTLRRARFTGPEIAELLGMPASTTSLILKREGIGRLPRLDAEPPNRYERKGAGELIHVDVKKLGRIEHPGHRATGRSPGHYRSRGAGWEYVHVAVDDATRLARAEVLPDERPETAVAFLRRAIEWFQSLGVGVERVMTDNGNAYRSRLHGLACRELGISHLRTQAYRPRTNGKAERFIKTLTDRWAYVAVYGSSSERAAALPAWLDEYNRWRQHRSLGRMPPMQRLLELQANNVVEAHT